MIYLDHAATVPMLPESIAAMEEALRGVYGNASATYAPARRAKTVLDESREILAESIGADWQEIYFTSGGTEADNQALIAGAEAGARAGRGHVITDSIEHHAVLHTCDYLRERGFGVTLLPVTQTGLVRPEDLAQALAGHPDTGLVSVMLANNEVGTIEPVEELAAAAAGHGCLFHTDAVQAYGKIPIDVKRIGCDLLSVSAHKIGGPKGIGFLYIRKGVRIGSLIHGGEQERGRRAGTENIPAIAGFAAAWKALAPRIGENDARVRSLQAYFFGRLHDTFPEGMQVNGEEPGDRRLAGNVSVSFPGISAAAVLMNLDLAGICASAGSACTTGLPEPSHVIMAMTGDKRRAEGTIRFTLGPENTREEIDRTVGVLSETVQRLRAL